MYPDYHLLNQVTIKNIFEYARLLYHTHILFINKIFKHKDIEKFKIKKMENNQILTS